MLEDVRGRVGLLRSDLDCVDMAWMRFEGLHLEFCSGERDGKEGWVLDSLAFSSILLDSMVTFVAARLSASLSIGLASPVCSRLI